jgi:iron complex outermembrane receptor protein
MSPTKNYASSFAVLLAMGLSSRIAAEEAEPKVFDKLVVTERVQDWITRNALPSSVLDGDELRIRIGDTIGATLQQLPGVNNASFGPGVGQPVIRGLSGVRVRLMQDALGTLDVSSISPDHANAVEPLLADRIEVLRGPAALLYGSGALGGAVNVLDSRIPSRLPERPLVGGIEQRYNSVSSEVASVGRVDGGFGKLALHLDGYYRDHTDMGIGGRPVDMSAEAELRGLDSFSAPFPNPQGYIPNTGARTQGGTGGMSWVDDWGFAGFSFNRLENRYGIPPGVGEERVRIDLTQSRYDFKSELKEPFAFAEALRMRLAYIDYQHVEVEDGTPGTVWSNVGAEGRIELAHRPIGDVKGLIGFQSSNTGFAALGEEAVVPRSDIENYGVFAIESLMREAVSYEAGLRVENQSVVPKGRAGADHTPVSASGSVQWAIDDQHSLSFGVARSQRAPQVQELFSQGVHTATASYDLGDPHLREETSYNLDLTYRFTHRSLSAEVNLFHNWINDFIYQQRTGTWFNEDTESFERICTGETCVPVFQTQQRNAIFKGYEAQVGFPLFETRHGAMDLQLFSDFVRAEFESGSDVPRLPPLRYGFQFAYVKDAFAGQIRLTRGAPQDRPGENETNTPGYVLLNAGAQYRLITSRDEEMLLFVRVNNLLDENIRNSTSYLRNVAPEPGRGAELGIRITF